MPCTILKKLKKAGTKFFGSFVCLFILIHMSRFGRCVPNDEVFQWRSLAAGSSDGFLMINRSILD